ncbi:hypothetical protein KP509_19G027900 [Ceratopteris richardii]|uniref:Secreted protein n=1 Tax=Ceratopteris richardii TaxID=49495 RepID=A0A8T2SKY8_CERRI|nr:hypothetical protein KP509_19G027600 [Ceratopteris richardii]KAH7352067.1 hypothetical protein KP509_19G027900 [Ceratopteris richardii]
MLFSALGFCWSMCSSSDPQSLESSAQICFPIPEEPFTDEIYHRSAYVTHVFPWCEKRLSQYSMRIGRHVLPSLAVTCIRRYALAMVNIFSGLSARIKSSY